MPKRDNKLFQISKNSKYTFTKSPFTVRLNKYVKKIVKLQKK